MAKEMLKQRLPQAVRVLQRIHTAKPAKWMWGFDPVNGVKRMLETVKSTHAIEQNEVRLIEGIISNTAKVVEDSLDQSS